MRIKIKDLRRVIREELYRQRDVLSPEKSDREQIGHLGKRTLDVDAQEDGDLPFHLQDQDFDLEDYFGPVPPVAEDPYATSDPCARDTGVLPTPGIYRG